MLHSQNKVAKVPTGPASNQNQKLPPQYDAQFKQVIKFYEARNYKKALKSIESILKDHPQHGETLSLKGLVISSLEAHERLLLRNEKSPTEYAKLGLSRNLHSYLCWQVFGLIHRSERNYKEAVKCYRQASRLDPENLQVLRDLATLQTQVRDHSGLLETRNAMLALKPSIKLHWIGLAVAHYLNQNYEVAYHVLEAFEKATAVTESPIQISELQLFKIQSLMRAGEYLAALDCVQRVRSKVLDTTVLLTLQAECELKLSKKTEAVATFVKLLQLSGENVEAVRGYVVARMACPIPSTMTPPLPRNATPDQRAEILDILEDLDQNILHGASSLVQREALDFCTPVQLPARLRRFALPYLLKSIPSLYSALKSLYRRTELWTCIESALLEWYEAFHASGRLPEMKTNNPVTLLWLLILLSHHGLRTGNLKQAWIYWEEARAHSPTMEHIYALKAKMLKHQGQHGAAADAMNEAREMDLADRYLTNRTVKYLIRADRLDEAAALYATFSRAKEGEVLSNAIDFQTLWFELEVAESYYRQGDVHSALRLFLVAEAHFQEFYEDQVDFHGYCLRKYTLRAYMDLLEFHNHSAQDATYRRATTGALICYLRILDEMCKRVQRNDSTAAVDVTVQEILASRRVATPAILGEITTKTMTGKSHGAVHPAETMDEARREVARLARVLEQYDLPESMRPLSEVNSMDDLPSCTACERPLTASSVGMDKHQSVQCIRTCILLTRAHVHNQSVLYATRYLAIAARTIHEHRRLFPSASNDWESPDCTQQHVLDCIQGIEQCLETLPRCEETKEVTEMIAHAVRNTLCNDTLRTMKAISR